MRQECADVPYSSRPVSMCNTTFIEKVELALHNDRRQSLRDVADNTGINRETFRLIVTEDLGMTKISARVVPKNLTFHQKLTRVRVCKDWLQNWDSFDKVISGDDSWIFEYDPETKRQSMEEKRLEEKRTKNTHVSKSKTKIWLLHSLLSMG